MPHNPLKLAAGLTILSGAAILAAGVAAYNTFLTRKAAGRNMASLPDEDILAGKADAAGAVKRGPVDAFFYRNSGMDVFFDQPHFPLYQEGVRWYLEQKPEHIAIASPRGGRIHADVIRSETPCGVWVVCLHGYTATPRDSGQPAKVFHEWGYNVLLPHLSGHGRSESPHVSMGWLDRFDIAAWCEHIAGENKNAQIVLFGGSMGGAAVMMATGEPLPGNVVCAVADCGYSSFWDQFAGQAKALLHLPVFPFVYALDAVVRLRQGFSMKRASCVEQVKKSKTPTLFLHGEDDDFVPPWMLDRVYDAAACEKEKRTFPGAGHGQSQYQPEEYFGAIRAFIGKYVRDFS